MTQTAPARHPRPVVFRDQSRDIKYLTRSTRTSEHSTTWSDGNVYPVIDVDIPTAPAGPQRCFADLRGAAAR